MKFLNDLLSRTLTFVDNHPRWLAAGVFIFSMLFHPALTLTVVAGVALYAYWANENKK